MSAPWGERPKGHGMENERKTISPKKSAVIKPFTVLYAKNFTWIILSTILCLSIPNVRSFTCNGRVQGGKIYCYKTVNNSRTELTAQ